MILVDTNIALRMAQPGHLHRDVALRAIDTLTLQHNETFLIAPQSLYELYVVCSRPKEVNGLGMSPERARFEVTMAKRVFRILPETSGVYQKWEDLIGKYAVRGKRAHDFRLAAIMIEHRVRQLLTFNDADFTEITEIQTRNPFDVLGIQKF